MKHSLWLKLGHLMNSYSKPIGGIIIPRVIAAVCKLARLGVLLVDSGQDNNNYPFTIFTRTFPQIKAQLHVCAGNPGERSFLQCVFSSLYFCKLLTVYVFSFAHFHPAAVFYCFVVFTLSCSGSSAELLLVKTQRFLSWCFKGAFKWLNSGGLLLWRRKLNAFVHL